MWNNKSLKIRIYICISLIYMNKSWKDIEKLIMVTPYDSSFYFILSEGTERMGKEKIEEISKICLYINFLNIFLFNKVNIFRIRKLQSLTDQEWKIKEIFRCLNDFIIWGNWSNIFLILFPVEKHILFKVPQNNYKNWLCIRAHMKNPSAFQKAEIIQANTLSIVK